jgi:hypothetical protein
MLWIKCASGLAEAADQRAPNVSYLAHDAAGSAEEVGKHE